MSDNTRATTAEVLGKFRKELIEQEVPDELADDLVRTAAKEIFAYGVEVKA